MRYVVEPMQYEDIEAVVAIEHECFALPWPASAYKRELRNPETNRYLVVREVPDDYRPWTRQDQEHYEAERGKSQQFLSSILPFLFTPPGTNRPLHKVVGYGGLWLVVDEAHITTIGIKPSFRGRGLGELLLIGLIDESILMKATWLTLEVRASNDGAQNLYRKYGFKSSGVRPRYYSDNNEDAIIMWSEPIASVEFMGRLERLRPVLQETIGNPHDAHTNYEERS